MSQRRHFATGEARAARADRFAAALAVALHELGLTHKALAQELGLTRYTVDSWTRVADPMLPGEENLARLCTVLDAHRPGLGQQLAAAAGAPARPLPPPDPAPVDRAPPLPGNLPHLFTHFVGRAADLAAGAALLAAQRLVTLTGPGGVGKTRLALQLAATLRPEFAAGAWRVELASLATLDLVPAAVAAALELREQPDQPLHETLRAYLQPRRLLLLLDNCEHLLAACALLAETLLAQCPDLHILATSREPLGLAGEAIWPVAPLGLPAAAAAPADGPGAAAPADGPAAAAPGDPPALAALAASDAGQLFLDRARAAAPDFTLTAQNATAVTAICRRLDGLPLALELAAARVRTLPVATLAARLDDSFQLLTSGSRSAPSHQRTLEASITWSYELLTTTEQTLLGRLAVFAGSWTLEAAEVVGGQPGAAVPDAVLAAALPLPEVAPLEVIDALSGLVNKSLVVLESTGAGGRYHLLETIRQYANTKLAASTEQAAIQARQAIYFAALARAHNMRYRVARQMAAMTQLEPEQGNIRAALAWALAQPDAELAYRLGTNLWVFWGLRGQLREGRTWLEAILAHPGPVAPGLRAAVLMGAGNLAGSQADYAAATAWLEENLALERTLGQPIAIANALNNLSLIVIYQGEYARAGAMLEECLAIYQAAGETVGTVMVLTNLGRVGRLLGNYTAARALSEQALALGQQGGLEDSTIPMLSNRLNLGRIAHATGDLATAAALFREGAALSRAADDRMSLPTALEGQARVLLGTAATETDLRAVGRLLGAAAALRAAGMPLPRYERADYDTLLAAARARLDPAVWAAEWARGYADPLADPLLDHPPPATAGG